MPVKTNLMFYSYLKSCTRVLNTGLEKINIKELICNVVTSPVFLVAYTNKRNTCVASYTL